MVMRTIREITYGVFPNKGQWEVFYITDRHRNNERRLCICEHEQDAKDIVIALKLAHENDLM